MKSITTDCPACRQNFCVPWDASHGIRCPHCQAVWVCPSGDFSFASCCLCGCKEFYVQKDFNRRLGCIVVGIAMILVPWTYGLSLPVAFVIDWALFRRTPDMAVCYLCEAGYRGFHLPEKIRVYNHHMAEGYEKRRKKIALSSK